jgi:hypothetical protein
MVALADWYILPILPPIGETFQTFKYQGKGDYAIGWVQRVLAGELNILFSYCIWC